MICPKCNATVPEDSIFCQDCGRDMRKNHGQKKDPFSPLGDLEKPTREIPVVVPMRNTLFCTGCGKATPADSVFCEHCGKQLHSVPNPKRFQWKKWMTVVSCCAVFLVVLLCVPWSSSDEMDIPQGGGYSDDNIQSDWNNGSQKTEAVLPLSDTCDYVLCEGIDNAGNTYELVANQKESALGYEISVGVIKNNEWLYPLSKDFPFLGEDGLFHVSVSMSGDSGTSLAQPNAVVQNIYFVDSGAFLLDCYKETDSWISTYDHFNIIFSCTSLKSYTVNCKESTLLYRYSEATFRNEQVESYGRIYTENGKFVLYTETSGTSSGWLEDQIFDWCILNAQTLSLDSIASGVEGVRPESILSEGLIFASDQCFYNTSGQKVIDLSEYNIDMWYNGKIYFEGGTCTFTAENSLGTEFLITIDKSGNVLNEVEK